MSERVYEILGEARDLEDSALKSTLLEEAIRIADSIHDEDLGAKCRMELIDSATHSGGDEKALVAFAWCLAKFDETPELSRHHRYGWQNR
ncbi:MAG: hypothetical protein AAF483_22255 [Planctomycetota bacterium]